MLQLLLAIALIVFIAWIVLSVIGLVFHGLINLLWIVIVIALIVWAWRALTGRHRAPSR
jgi:hypothetical protein